MGNKPQVMIKIKAELGRVVGANRKLEESDIDNLHYLRATVEETLRLHPPLPLLVPRKAIRDTNFMILIMLKCHSFKNLKVLEG